MSLETPRTYCAMYDVKIEGAYPDSDFKRVVDAAFAERLERELIALRNENEALRDAIEALHECVDGTGRRSDADVAELLNGAMKIPRANSAIDVTSQVGTKPTSARAGIGCGD